MPTPTKPTPTKPAPTKRRTRLRRGPLTIGEPAPPIVPRLADAEPYRPDTICDGGEIHGLTVRAASVRGLYKRHLGEERQDDLCLRPHERARALVVAIADGVSAAPRAGLGAALAVRHAAAALARQLDAGPDEIDWHAVFGQAAWALLEERRRHDPGAGTIEASAELATTLTVAVVAREAAETQPRVRLASVGDSPVFVLSGTRYERLLGEGPSVDGLIGGSVNALPRDLGSLSTAACRLAPETALLLCTDGLGLPLADGRGEVGRMLARELRRPPDVVDFARLLDFSRATYDDDRTLVVVWPRAERESATS
jgi:hypothetical protein